VRVYVKVVEGEMECEINSEVELPFEVEVSDEEFQVLVHQLGGDLAKLIYQMLEMKSRKILVAPGLGK